MLIQAEIESSLTSSPFIFLGQSSNVMGISGLLPLLKSIQQQKHLSELSGKTLAVDAYVWLHKGAYGCAAELVTGKTTTKSVASIVILPFDALSDREIGDKS